MSGGSKAKAAARARRRRQATEARRQQQRKSRAVTQQSQQSQRTQRSLRTAPVVPGQRAPASSRTPSAAPRQPVRSATRRPAPPSAARPPSRPARPARPRSGPSAGGLSRRVRANRPRVIGVVLLGGLAAAAVLGWAMGTGGALDGVAGSSVGRAAPDRAVSPSVVPSPSGSGAADTAPGTSSATRVVVGPDGSRRVTTAFRPRRPLARVVLSPPRGQASGVTVSDLVVEADGRTVLRAAGAAALPRRLPLGAPAEDLTISYTEYGGVRQSTTRATRALVAVSPLGVGPRSAASGPARVTVTGGRLLSMTCARGSSLPTPCGDATANGWAVDLERGAHDSRVYAQLDLPALK